ncbi:hypothetical protein HAX54_021420, partial [Datura stramonium]|nr:hypothetical protein [Datura stramonium]
VLQDCIVPLEFAVLSFPDPLKAKSFSHPKQVGMCEVEFITGGVPIRVTIGYSFRLGFALPPSHDTLFLEQLFNAPP